MKYLVLLGVIVMGVGVNVPLPGPAGKADPPRVQILSGEAARAYLQERMRQSPILAQSLARSAADAAKKGHKQTNQIDVVKRGTLRRPHVWQQLVSIAFPTVIAQDGAADSNGAYTFLTYDDGDPNTWEGDLVSEDYGGPYQWRHGYAQLETEHYQQILVITADEYGAGGDGWQRPARGPAPNPAWQGRAIPAQQAGSCPTPSIRTVAATDFSNCACFGCQWGDVFNRMRISMCVNRELLTCAAWKSPAIIGGCRIAERMGGGSWSTCAIAVGGYDFISCEVDLIRDRYSRCGWCG